MSIIRIEDIAHVRFRAPDLDAMETFLAEFGLVRAHCDDSRLFMRGLGTSPFLHATEKGEAGFAGLGLRAQSAGDLNKLAKALDAKVEALDAPGGGQVVRLTDPDGFAVDVVAGQAPVAALPAPPREALNDVRRHDRLNQVKRVAAGPAHVLRLGHCVLNVSNFRASEAWYKERFGFITSDELYAGTKENVLGAFMRCDRGAQPTDHHTLFLAGFGEAKFNHAAFEVADMDDLMAGNAWLASKERRHEWGVGRHVLGSQIFDYWRDPWGHTVEHWTDGDLLDAAWGSRSAAINELVGLQWGPPMPPTMGR